LVYNQHQELFVVKPGCTFFYKISANNMYDKGMETTDWRSGLKYDPVPPLLAADDAAIVFWTKRDLLDEEGEPKSLWNLPLARKITSKQQADGSWQYPGGNQKIRSSGGYDQLETFRNVGYLVEIFGFDITSPVITKAADFLLGFQTNEGDIRGILGNQYTPYYTAAILELLIKAGYADDPRVHQAFRWLATIRQDDGGWAIPLRTHHQKLAIITTTTTTLTPDTSMPSSHLVTGVVLRAYAAHRQYRDSIEAKAAGTLLLARLFQKDTYPDRASPDYWLRFTYPFWFTDLLSATDTLSKLGFTVQEPAIQRAMTWFIDNQQADDLWHVKTLKNQKQFNTGLWISLSICRVLKRLYGY
jgi:hypothetical protein